MLRIDSGAQRQCNQVIRYDAIGCAGAMQTSDHLDEIPHPSPRKGKIIQFRSLKMISVNGPYVK